MNFINEEVRLEGEFVELIPLQESHFEELETIAHDQRIWEFLSVNMSSKELRLKVFSNALIEKTNCTQYPFVVFHKQKKKIVGSTRFMEIFPQHKKLEIGWTWLHPEVWATVVNVECKLLLLTYCFEVIKANRVQLKTDENNWRSRKAIAKIGGQFEGILRQDWIRENGTIRNSAFFSLIQSDWEEAKSNLLILFKNKVEK